MRDLVTTQVAELQSSGRPITCGGYLDKNQAAQFLHETDYLILPSRIESIPVIYSDALQADCPLVATPVGDLPRLMQKYKTGVLSTAADAASMAEALQQTLAAPPSQYAQALKDARLDFSVKQTAARLLNQMRLAGAVDRAD